VPFVFFVVPSSAYRASFRYFTRCGWSASFPFRRR
jgi:hypothetical protein